MVKRIIVPGSYRLSPNFQVREFTRSDTAKTHGIDNFIYKDELSLYLDLAVMLQAGRDHFGSSFRINSGKRSPKLNRKVGGSPTSAHKVNKKKGWVAADFWTARITLAEVFDWYRLKSGLPFDQIILEYGRQPRHNYDDVIHLGRANEPRRMALVGSTHNRSGYIRVPVE